MCELHFPKKRKKEHRTCHKRTFSLTFKHLLVIMKSSFALHCIWEFSELFSFLLGLFLSFQFINDLLLRILYKIGFMSYFG